MTRSYTIGALARAAGVPVSTVRYYGRRGLLPPDGRSASNYRLYSDASLQRLRFIRAAQASGFTLADVARLLALARDSDAPCGDVRELIGARLRALDRRLDALRRARAELQAAFEECGEAERADPCQVVDRLRSAGRAAPGPGGR